MLDTLNTDSLILSELGERIAQYRLKSNITQARLAKEAGVSKPTLQRIEAGKSAQLSSFIRVMRALGLIANFDALLPPPSVSPLQQIKSRGKKRHRASGRRVKVHEKEGPWTWGDDS